MQPSRSRPAQPAGGPAHLAPPPLSSSSPTGERRVPTRAHRRASTSCFPGHLLLPPRRLERPGRRHAAPTALSLSHSFPLPWFSLPRAHPSAAAAIARRGHSHRLPLASPSCPGAPPRRQLPPRRATQAGVPRGAVAVAKFDSGRRGSSPAIRELPGIPDLALALAGSAVSPRTEPPPPRVRLRRLGLSSAMAEARLRSSLSPALLRRPFGHASAPSTLAAPRSAPLAL